MAPMRRTRPLTMASGNACSDLWTPMPTAGSTAAQQVGGASAWSGSELLVWGGDTAATGARFTP